MSKMWRNIQNIITEESGMFTVEMAFLLPLLLSVVCFIMTMLFWKYDQVVLGAMADRWVMASLDEGVLTEELEEYLEEICFFVERPVVSQKKKGRDIKISVSTCVHTPFPDIMQIIQTDGIRIAWSGTYRLEKPVEEVRRRRLFETDDTKRGNESLSDSLGGGE
ncbi:MAG: TadE family protein [Lachnospiraceae bacterium]